MGSKAFQGESYISQLVLDKSAVGLGRQKRSSDSRFLGKTLFLLCGICCLKQTVLRMVRLDVGQHRDLGKATKYLIFSSIFYFIEENPDL